MTPSKKTPLRSVPVLWHLYPNELMLHIAGSLTTFPDQEQAQPNMTSATTSGSLDLRLWAVDRKAHGVAATILAKKFAFVRIIAYGCPDHLRSGCPEEHGCRQRMKAVFEEWFGPVEQQNQLVGINECDGASLSVVMIHLDSSCADASPLPLHEPRLVVFLELNNFRSLMLANLVQRYHPFRIEVKTATPTLTVHAKINGLLNTIGSFVFNKMVELLNTGLHTDERSIHVLQHELDTQNITKLKHALNLIKAHVYMLQEYIQAGCPLSELVPQAMIVVDTNTGLMDDMEEDFPDDDLILAGKIDRALCCHASLVMDALSYHLLEANLTPQDQGHDLLLSDYCSWLEQAHGQVHRTITFLSSGWADAVSDYLDRSVPSIPQPALDSLTNAMPIIKSMVQFSLALARLQLLRPGTVFPDIYHLALPRNATEAVEDAKMLLETVQAFLYFTSDDSVRLMSIDREPNLFWHMEMQYLTRQIDLVRQNPNPTSSQYITAMHILKQPCLRKGYAGGRQYSLPMFWDQDVQEE